MTRLELTLLAGLCALSLVSLSVGQSILPLSAWFDGSDPRHIVFAELRAPRVLLAILIGGALGLSGAVLQGYSRNALADPGVLGVSSMASAGAVIAIFFGLSAHWIWALPVAAALGAGVGAALLTGIAALSESATTFLLAGVVLNTLGGAVTALALTLAPGPWAQGEIVNWLMGALTDSSFDEVRLAAPFILAGGAVMLSLGGALDALTLGETSARGLGVSLSRTRMLLTIGAALATGASVAVSGVIGFVGLIAPHLLRRAVGGKPSALLWPSALAGALILLAADTVVRLVPTGSELKLGVAMSAVGAPFFIWALVRRGAQGR